MASRTGVGGGPGGQTKCKCQLVRTVVREADVNMYMPTSPGRREESADVNVQIQAR